MRTFLTALAIALGALGAITAGAAPASAICVEESTIWVLGRPITVDRRCIPPE